MSQQPSSNAGDVHTCHVKDAPSSSHAAPPGTCTAADTATARPHLPTENPRSSPVSTEKLVHLKKPIYKYGNTQEEGPLSARGAPTVPAVSDECIAREPERTGVRKNLPDLALRSGPGSTRAQHPHQQQERNQLPQFLSTSSDSRAHLSGQSTPTHTSYSRSYPLTTVEHKVPDSKLTVNRSVQTTYATPWNAHSKVTAAYAKETLPRIDTQKKNKFDYLSEGVSLAQVEQRRSPARPEAVTTDSACATAAVRDRACTGQGGTSPSPIDEQRSALAAPRTPPSAAPDTEVAMVTSRGTKTVASPPPPPPPPATPFYAGDGDLKEDLLAVLHTIDFARASEELHQFNASDFSDKTELLKCLLFFRVAATDQACLTVGDIHQLLLLFTPCGVLLQEAADFLWEECDHRTSLSLADFICFGIRLRDRLGDYAEFASLDDSAKLMRTYARVFPREPPLPASETEKARQRLEKLATGRLEAVDGDTRALRTYEVVFLADYHEDLYQRGVLSRDQVADMVMAGNAVAGGDLCADLQRFHEELYHKSSHPRNEVSVQTEAASQIAGRDAANNTPCRWSDDQAASGDMHYSPYPLSDTQHTADDEDEQKATHKGTSHRSTREASKSRRRRGKAKSGGRGGHHGKTTEERPLSLQASGSSSRRHAANPEPSMRASSRGGRPSFDLERQPKGSNVKYLGHSIQDDYAERALQDTRLIYLLQANYV